MMKADDEIDQYFEEVRDEMIEFIREEKGENGKRIFDLIMVTKYLERIGDHATNIAECDHTCGIMNKTSKGELEE